MRKTIMNGRTGTCVAASLLLAATAHADVPRLVSYQGLLTDEIGMPLAGPVDLSIRLYNAASEGTLLFSETQNAVPLVDGVFSINVGSATGGGVPDSALNAAAVWLGVSVDGAAELTPRTRLGMVPYAAKGAAAERLVIPDTFTTAASVDASGRVGVGTLSPGEKFHVAGSALLAGQSTVTRALVTQSTLSTIAPHNATAELKLEATRTFFGGGSPVTAGGAIGASNLSNGTRAIFLDAADAGMSLSLRSQGTEKMTLAAEGARFRSNSATNLLISGALDDGHIDLVKSAGATPSARITFNGFTDPGTHEASLDFYTKLAGNAGLVRHMTLGANGTLGMFHPNGDQTVAISPNEPIFGAGVMYLQRGAGVVGARLSARVPVAATDRGGGLDLYLGNGVNNIEMRAAFEGGSPGAWMALKDNGAERVTFAARNGSTGVGGLIEVKNNAGLATVRIIGDTGGGFGRVQTSVLEITGGSDLAEPFDVRGERVEPGMVVVIDPDHPGQLKPSTEAYDRKVAGIVSGAGGVRPGMLMGQSGSIADGEHHVALTGRVYCWCDASNGAIEPGDMLTTSPRPGYAMKVTDHSRAHGAVLGKAMTRLAEGQGLVLVLVQPH